MVISKRFDMYFRCFKSNPAVSQGSLSLERSFDQQILRVIDHPSTYPVSHTRSLGVSSGGQRDRNDALFFMQPNMYRNPYIWPFPPSKR